MKKENKIESYKSFVIHTEEGIENGTFFRNPIQKVDYDSYGENSLLSGWEYLNKLKNPIRKIFEYIKGNGSVVKNIKSWSKEDDWAGFRANILCLPFYFKREYRKLEAYSQSKDSNIQSIVSYGYESPYNWCGGDCEIESTVITLKSGKKIKITGHEQYNYTYEFKIKEIIDTDSINDLVEQAS